MYFHRLGILPLFSVYTLRRLRGKEREWKEGEGGGEDGAEGWGTVEEEEGRRGGTVEEEGRDGLVERGDLPRLGNRE